MTIQEIHTTYLCLAIIGNFMLHGYGSQKYLKKSYSDDRAKALLDRSKYGDKDLENWEVEFPDGGGRLNPETYEIKQFPYPMDTAIRPKETINMKKADPRLGEASD